MAEPLGLTGFDTEVNGFLLNDCPSAREVGMADVVGVVVRGEHVGEVEVAILAHCHPLILFDVQDLCGGGGRGGRGEDLRPGRHAHWHAHPRRQPLVGTHCCSSSRSAEALHWVEGGKAESPTPLPLPQQVSLSP